MLTTSGAGSLWEQWYECAAAPQRQQALARAGEQGILFAYQLPAPEGAPVGRGADSLAHSGGAASRRPLLTALLHGPAPELEPVRPAPIQPIDTDLDEVQRDAVARALGTPDLALIQGYPGTGKSRIIAEVLRQSARAGQRVLFLAPCAAAIDRVLDRLATEEMPGILRCLGAGETEAGLPASVVPLTLAHRLRRFEQQTLPAARQALETASAVVEVRRRETSIWPQIDECLQRHARVNGRLQEVKERRACLADTIAAELDATGEAASKPDWEAAHRAFREAVAEADEKLKKLREECDILARRQKEQEAEERRLAPPVDVRQARRWWTVAYWSNLVFQGSRLQQLEQIRGEIRQANDRLNELQAEEKGWTSRRSQSEERLAQKRREVIDKEHARRDRELAGNQTALEKEFGEAARHWQGLVTRLGASMAPSEPTAQAVQTARAVWSAQLETATQEVLLRKQWLEALQQAQATLPAQLAASAHIVAATAAGLPGDLHFGDAVHGPLFDLLVIDEAQRLGEAELIALARRARRWALVGDVAAEMVVPPPPARRNGPARAQPVQARPAFQRLWCQLHCDPRRLTSRWRVVGGRLIGGLRPIAAEQTPWVQHEAVFDRPEIELRIVSPPRQEAVVAEVLFPGSTPIEQAKEFIYHELQELSVQPGGPALRWSEDDRTITLHLGAGCNCSTTTVSLESGIRELLTRCVRMAGEAESPCRTCALEFSRAEGWDRTRAERWAAERLNLRDSGRTAVLCRPYRAGEPLAHFLSEILYAGLWSIPCTARPQTSPADGPAVQFVAVPGAGSEGRRGSGFPAASAGSGVGTATLAPRTRAVKGGAGLEIDLAAPRRYGSPGFLPDDLCAGLPAQGIVNFAEARAIVEVLETMARDPAFTPPTGGTLHGTRPAHAGPTVAVISLFASQVELLRRLIARSTVLANSPLKIEVGLPGAFHQRDVLVALVGLTRSHASRAVPFSDSPQSLFQALTRPAVRLVLFGDTGTMARRSQWHGGLDHLDEIVGPVEQALVGQLLGQLSRICVPPPEDRPSQDVPARTSRSRESSGV
jgi:hypothetical protein